MIDMEVYKIDKKLENNQAEMVRRELTHKLKEYGFKRTKTSFYTKLKEDRVEFIHLHKFSFTSSFRVHIGIRLLCDKFEAIALNGPDSDWHKKYKLDFNDTEESISLCVENIVRFILEVGFPWHEKWRNPDDLIKNEDTPIDNECKEEYLKYIKGQENQELIKQSLNLLGLKE